MAKKQYKLIVEPITAVHIGTGEELTPLDYKVDTKLENIDFKRPMYFRYTWNEILDQLQDKPTKLQEFLQISNKNNMNDLRNFFYKNISIKAVSYFCETTKEFAQKFTENVQKDPVQNAATVLEMYRPNGQQTPVIPGSSIKGAIRTAYLNYLLTSLQSFEKNRLDQKNEKQIQSQLFQMDKNFDAKTDPFRCLSISDCTIPAKKGSQLVGCLKNAAVNNHTEVLDVLGKQMQIQAEVIRGVLSGCKNIGDSILQIDEDLFRANSNINKLITMEEIQNACNTFYYDELENEIEKFYKYESENTELISDLEKLLLTTTKTDNSFILRVGRWSQVEFVTLKEPFRHPKVPRDKGYGGTRTVFNYDGQYLPMGWCKCTITEIKA